MSEISRQALFGKLNPLLFKSLESATVFCKLRGNPYVELVHWLHQLLQETDSDLIRLLRHFAVDSDRLATDVLQSLDRLPRGATSISDFSAQIESSIERGWVYATLMYGESQIRSAYWLSGMLRTRVLANELRAISGGIQQAGRACPERGVRPRAAGFAGIAPEGRGRQRPGRRARRGERRHCRGGRARRGPEALHGGPDGARAPAGTRPGHRPRRGSAPDGGHPHAPASEQPHPGRRGRRGQDGGGGRPRAAHRGGRRAATAQGRATARGGHRPAAGRREHEGRVREPPALAARRGAGQHGADRAVHRRGAHARRRGRAGRHGRCRQPAQAGAGARRAAHHRRHHLGRVQEIHREGPGAHPALPARADPRAGRGQGGAHAARRGREAGKAITRCVSARTPWLRR